MEQELINRGIVLKGHFKLSSGLHSDTYINKDAIYRTPDLFRLVNYTLTEMTAEFKYDIVTGPAIAGAILAAPISMLTGKTFIYPEKIPTENDKTIMKFRRGYDKVIYDKDVVIIEDIITTGNSVKQTMDAVLENGGRVSGIVCIWNREGWEPNVGIEIVSIINTKVVSWNEEDCPQCKSKIPVTNPKE